MNLRGVVAVLITFLSQARGAEEVQTQRRFEYCSAVDDFEDFEFQTKTNVQAFSAFSTPDIATSRAKALFKDFIAASNNSLRPKKSHHEELFKEDSWFLTQPDGTPLPDDKAENVPYTESCYIRVRQKRDVDDGELDDDLKLSSAIKIRGVDFATFVKPSGKVKDSEDCDVYVGIHRATYKAKIKKVDYYVDFSTFGEALKLFPWASDYFLLDPATPLPKRDAYFVHRYRWKDVSFHGIEIECTLELRFRDAEKALIGEEPYAGEFSCAVETDDIEDASGDVEEILEQLRDVFVAFQHSEKWVEHTAAV